MCALPAQGLYPRCSRPDLGREGHEGGTLVDSWRRISARRAHSLASTLPAVARATAGCFVRCEWMIGLRPCRRRPQRFKQWFVCKAPGRAGRAPCACRKPLLSRRFFYVVPPLSPSRLCAAALGPGCRAAAPLGAAQRPRWVPRSGAGRRRLRASTNRAFFSGKLCHQHLAAGPLSVCLCLSACIRGANSRAEK